MSVAFQYVTKNKLKDDMLELKKEQAMDYSPYGGIFWSLDNSEKQRDNWAGKEKDKENGLGDHGVRKYDHLIGRFTSIDPLWSKYLDFNPYNYTGNSPILYIDLDGYLKRDSKGKLIFTLTGTGHQTHVGMPGVEAKSSFGYLTADDGTRIKANKNESEYKEFDTDCHGFTCTKGEYWIDNPELDKILEGDNYKRNENPQPSNLKVGDLVVYRDSDGNVVHSALIWGISEDEVLVHSVSGVRDIEPVIDIDEDGYPDRDTSVEYWRRPE